MNVLAAKEHTERKELSKVPLLASARSFAVRSTTTFTFNSELFNFRPLNFPCVLCVLSRLKNLIPQNHEQHHRHHAALRHCAPNFLRHSRVPWPRPLEKVYENALVNRLRKVGLDVKQQHPITVYDEDGTIIGEYLADLFVDNRLIIELKAAKTLADEHIAQILGYLKGSRTEHGLLINFGSYRFQMKKYVLSDTQHRSLDGRLSCFFASLFALSAFFRG